MISISPCHCPLSSLFFYPYFLLVSCAEPKQYCSVTPPLGRHTETTKHVVECATGCGRQEPLHGDGGAEACGYSPHSTHQKLYYRKRYSRCSPKLKDEQYTQVNICLNLSSLSSFHRCSWTTWAQRKPWGDWLKRTCGTDWQQG